MTDTIIVPTADVITAPAITTLGTLRPKAAPLLAAKSGVYWHPILGFRGQAALMLQRLASLVESHRLSTASGTDLLDYVASEYDTVPETDPVKAQGTVTLGRGTDVVYPAGDYPAGTRISREDYTTVGVHIPAAEYETLVDAHIDGTSMATVTIPIQAVSAGSNSNQPQLVNADVQPTIGIPDTVANVVVTGFDVAGGSDGPDDLFVKQYAKAYSLGQYGPTIAATRLGALAATGVRHLIVYDVPLTGTETCLIADKSWGSAVRWAGQVQQSMYDNLLVGFGCKVNCSTVRNKIIKVELTVALRDPTFLGETTDITTAIQTAVASYFNDRPDWNTWTALALSASVELSHPKVYNCPSAVVKDAASLAVISEIPTADFTAEQFHYLLPFNAVAITYTGPA